ncbi:unnamed protein product [Ectocarpus sp. 12 AP-2014]
MRSKRITFAAQLHIALLPSPPSACPGLDASGDVPQGFRRRLHARKVLDLGLESTTAVGFSGAFHSWETHCY